MATLPTTLGDSLPTPVPQRTVNGYQSQAVPDAEIQAGQATQADALAMQDKQNRLAIIDAQSRSNQAKADSMTLLYGNGKDNPGLYSVRGADAVGMEDKYNAAFNDIKTKAMNGVTNVAAQRALTFDLQNLNLTNVDGVKRYTMDQTRAYKKDLADSQNSLDSQRAGLEYNNDATIQKLLVSATATGNATAKLNGHPVGSLPYQQDIINAKSNVLSQQLDALSRSKDPNVLMQFNDKYEQYRQSGNLTLEAVDRFDKVKELIAPTIEAVKARQNDNHAQLTYQVPDDKIIQAIGQQESSGQQTGGPGSVGGPNETTVSPKGASGAMGIMPDTALALAGGDQAKANQILNDGAASKEAGAAYYQQMKKQFGDTRMALMAYNAGPTIVSDWMNGTNNSEKNPDKLRLGDPAKGQVTVDQFIAKVPWAETRAYPGQVLTKAGYGGSIGPMNMAQAQDNATRMTPGGAEAYLAMVKRDNAAYAAQQDQVRKQTMDAGFKYMTDQGANYHTMPVDLQSQIDSAGLTQEFKDYNPRAPSNPDSWTFLNNLSPQKLAETDLNRPGVRMNLSPQNYQEIVQRQQSLGNPQALATENDLHGLVKKAATQMGIDLHEKYDFKNTDADGNPSITVDGNQDFIRMMSLAHQGIASYTAKHNGMYPETAEVQKIVDGAIMSHANLKTNNWFPSIPGNENTYSKPVPTYKLTVGATDAEGKPLDTNIAPDDAKTIANYLNQKGVTPTNDAIISMYAAWHGK